MIEIQADTRKFQEAMKKAGAAGPGSRRAAIVELARAYGTEVMKRAPVDTGRFKAGEAEGLNMAGAGPFPVPAIGRSPGAKSSGIWLKIEKRLIIQERFWKLVCARMISDGSAFYKTKRGTGETKHYRDAKKKAQLSSKYLAEWYASKGNAAVIAVEYWQRASEARRRKKPIDPNEILTRAYQKVYGGRGRIIDGGGDSIVQLVNKEPHAYIVESKKGVRITAINAVGRDVLTKVGAGYVKRVATAAGLATRI